MRRDKVEGKDVVFRGDELDSSPLEIKEKHTYNRIL